MLPDVTLSFYVVAAFAVLITGISKSGFSGGMGALTVPLMAMFISPFKAAAIMLPILCCMDLLSIWAYRKSFHRKNLIILVLGALSGIGIGTLTYSYVDANDIRILLGLLTLLFGVSYFVGDQKEKKRTEASSSVGGVCGVIAGFTSFVAHAGGPPVKFFLLRQRLDKTVFVGTNVAFFLIVNQVKLIPYAWMGQFSNENLLLSLIFLPIVPLGIWLGLKLHKLIAPELFYQISYLMMILAGGKLLYDGMSPLVF
ncbi:sulfite exporter TauE/SafE family protein [Kiloniella litopenaei]|uniref:sulfite exporter TauE/SafE family protein n=1 Tax=Kiloniella litopenaei TaxID=1549748 RepID=UPI000695E57D|nr:sulfite exporter TauE/SafE family protein [Kiloniella litopenaei]